jgi:MYXO-CTERM domain-containing protein
MSVKRNRNTIRAARLEKPLEKRIRDYSLAALGTGAAAFAPAASGAVVVTNLNYMLPLNTVYTITVGGHHVMNVSNSAASAERTFLVRISSATVANRFWGPASLGNSKQPPVNQGSLIPGIFPSHTKGALVFSTTESTFNGFMGNGHFIGFSFGTGPDIHYGWVEFNISQPGGSEHPYSVTVVAAAYETVAGQPLAAGATTDSIPPSTPAPNSLWLMALGAAGLGGLELLRRRRTA